MFTAALKNQNKIAFFEAYNKESHLDTAFPKDGITETEIFLL